MPEINGINTKPRLFEGWREVTTQMARDAEVTRKLAHALLISLGQSKVVRVVAFRIANALGEVNTNVNPDSLAEKIANPDPSKVESIKATLIRARDDSSLVEQAYSINQADNIVTVLTESDVAALKVLPETSGIRIMLENGARSVDFVEGKFELVATVDSLLKALTKDFSKRSNIRRTNTLEVKKAKKNPTTKPVKREVVSTLPGISFSIKGEEPSPISALRLMGVNREAKVLKALEKCMKSDKKEYVYKRAKPSKPEAGYINLIRGTFANDSKSKPNNALLMYKGKRFEVSKLENDENGFRIKLVK